MISFIHRCLHQWCTLFIFAWLTDIFNAFHAGSSLTWSVVTIYSDVGARSRLIGNGYVITPHSLLNPRYLFLATKSLYIHVHEMLSKKFIDSQTSTFLRPGDVAIIYTILNFIITFQELVTGILFHSVKLRSCSSIRPPLQTLADNQRGLVIGMVE